MSLFANKTLLITGGTGSFGNAVLNGNEGGTLNDYLIVSVVADDFFGQFFQLVVNNDYVVTIPTYGTGNVKKDSLCKLKS